MKFVVIILTMLASISWAGEASFSFAQRKVRVCHLEPVNTFNLYWSSKGQTPNKKIALGRLSPIKAGDPADFAKTIVNKDWEEGEEYCFQLTSQVAGGKGVVESPRSPIRCFEIEGEDD